MTLQTANNNLFNNVISHLDEMRNTSEFIPPSIILLVLILGGFIIFKAIKKIKKNMDKHKDEFESNLTKEIQASNNAPSFGRWITEPASTTTINSLKSSNRLQTQIGYALLVCGIVIVLSTFFTTKTIYL